MLNKKRALSLLLILTSVNLASAANIASGVSGVDNYLSKAKIDELLKREPSLLAEINSALVNDLQVGNIANYFDCRSILGYNFLTYVLSAPISPKSDCETIAKRQALIMELVKNPEFKSQTDALALEIQKNEKIIIELLSEQFKAESCPEQAELKLLSDMKHPFYPAFKFFYTHPTGKIINTANSYFKFALFSLIVSGKFNNAFLDRMPVIKDFSSRTKRIITAGQLSHITYNIGRDYLNAAKKRNKMHALSKLIAISEQFEVLCAQNNVAAQFKISDITNQDSLNLIHALKKSRYTQATSYVFLTPNVHSFLYQIYEKDNCFSEVFATIAELDACNAIATKILANQDGKNQFCFTQFLDQAAPEIKMIKGWNLLVGQEKAVANSLHEKNKVIFSGVNAGGKTTFTRSIMQNILLAQTFGVAAASEFEFTPFDIIGSYINISDDLIAGNSLFVSEVKRAQEIKAKIDAIAGTNLKYFFALDELFTGTGADAGEQCACDFISRIASSENSLFVYPTHFNKLKHLGDENANCVNYRVDSAVKLEDGSLVYPFTVSKGASYDNIALDIATNANLFN